MTVRELFNFLMQSDDKEFGNALVVVCDKRDNPITDGDCVVDAVRIEWQDGDKRVVLQTG